jgi:4-hydroxybenzoate polyprenyltransferase
VAGASPETSLVLGLAMFCLQASIGAVNDIVDVERDRAAKPGKPLPAGLVGPTLARLVAGAGLAAGLLLSAAVRLPLLIVALVGLGLGYGYDFRLKASRWSWLPFALGIGLLPVYDWFGATGHVPAIFLVLLPLAVLGGAALALANQLADDERDQAGGLLTTVGVLGRDRAWRLGLALHAIVAVVAVATLIRAGASFYLVAAADVSIALIALGLHLGRSRSAARRERAWELQAIGLGCLALAWLAGVAGAGLIPG